MILCLKSEAMPGVVAEQKARVANKAVWGVAMVAEAAVEVAVAMVEDLMAVADALVVAWGVAVQGAQVAGSVV